MSLPAPEYDPARHNSREPFHEAWTLKLNTPDAQHVLWIRINLLISGNGFRQIAETRVIYAQRSAEREVVQVAVKQPIELSAFRYDPSSGVQLGSSAIEANRSHGQAQSKGHSISWNLRYEPANPADFELVPSNLDRFGWLGSQAQTLAGDLRFSGTATVDGRDVRFDQAPGMLGHSSGTRHPRSWIWGHSNLFVDDRGQAADFVFEGLSMRTQLLGILPLPQLSCFYFHYRGEPYLLNSLWDALHSRSRNSFTEWRFQADQGSLSFRGRATAEHRDFAGSTLENTNGALLYGASSELSNLEVHVYRHGKLEAALYSNGSASLELISPDKNPYVPQLI